MELPSPPLTSQTSPFSLHGKGESALHRPEADRVGVIASVLCAIHCAVTPFLLLFAPAFGEIWAHPASHWIVALFVVPLALVMVLRGFRIHRRRWIVATGILGIALVIVGAIIPYWPGAEEAKAEVADGETESGGVAAINEAAPEEGDSDVFVWKVGDELPGEEEDEVFVWVAGEEMPGQENGGCLDSCCPSLVTDREGNTTLHIPPASLVTTLGGVALICTHLGNLGACRKKKAGDCCDSGFC